MKTQKVFNILVFILIFSTLAVLTIQISISRAGLSAGAADQAMALPEPPVENPHPPVTEQDKKRVAFAEEVLKKILMMDTTTLATDPQPTAIDNSNTLNLQINTVCLANPDCLKNNQTALNYLHSIHQMYGKVVEFRHMHIIPWAFENFEKNKTSVNNNDTEKLQAKPTAKFLEKKAAQEAMAMIPAIQKDEYMLHSYVKFGKDLRWYHVDLIVSEDAQGNLEFRRFFITIMPLSHDDLPPGVVC